MFRRAVAAALLFAGGVAAQETKVITLYAEGTTPHSVNHATMSVKRGQTYSVTMEVLRNDLAHSSERMVSALLDGRDIGGCNPDGGDFDCTYFSCPTDEFMISSDDGFIDVQYTMSGHSYDCKCDKVTGLCVAEHTELSGLDVVPTTAAVRFTLREIGYTITTNHALSGYNDERLPPGQTRQSCAEACDARDWCVSWDWIKDTTQCDLSRDTAVTAGVSLSSDTRYDHYLKVLDLPSDVVVRKENRECNSGDTLLGSKKTMVQCAGLCRANPDCRFFIFGHNGANNKDGWCYQEFTQSADCPEGWEVDDYTFYEILGREPTPEPTTEPTTEPTPAPTTEPTTEPTPEPTGGVPSHVYNYPACNDDALAPGINCLVNGRNQVSGRIYRVADVCYKAISNCFGCLDDPSSYVANGHLEVVDCSTPLDLVYRCGPFWFGAVCDYGEFCSDTGMGWCGTTSGHIAQSSTLYDGPPATLEPTSDYTAPRAERFSGDLVSPNANNHIDWEMGVDGTDIYKCAKDTDTCLVNSAGSRHTFTEAARPSIGMVDAGGFSHNGGDGTWSFADGKAVFSGANTDHSFSFAAGAVNL